MLVASTAVGLGLCEAILRLKNASMKNYDIEMWRYGRELTRRSDIAALGHEHVESAHATLQSVDIRINEKGLRGGPVPPRSQDRRRIVFLGGSVTLGWGVAEDETVTSRLRQMFAADGRDVEVLNAGIANYNAARYVRRFEQKLAELQPSDIVVHYFVRDAEKLDAGGGNIALRHSQLAVTTWIAFSRYLDAHAGKTLEQHYRDAYRPDAPGYLEMRAALHELAGFARSRGIRVYFAMTPDTHDLVDYKFGYIHEGMRAVAAEEGLRYVDLLASMRNLTPSQLWTMPGDAHPNGTGHRLMAEAIYPVVRDE